MAAVAGVPDRLGPALWALLGIGLAVRVLLALTTDGVTYDIDSYRIVATALREAPLDVYASVNDARDHPRWPYPPGYFAWLLPAGSVDNRDLFDAFVRVPPILCDLGLAWLAQDVLGRRGASRNMRLAGAATIALGPSFIAISGFHGQLDSVAILPAALAFVAWERSRPERGAVYAGLLLGVGAAIKTVPALLVLALLPATRSRSEAARLVGATALVPLVALAPFVLAAPGAIGSVLGYRGVPGLGGLSLVAQPELPAAWLGVRASGTTALTDALQDARSPIMLVALALLALVLLRARPWPWLAAVMVWLTVYVFGVNLFLQYLVWGLPFLVLAGAVWQAVALQALLLPPTLVRYWETPGAAGVDALYTAPMLLVWLVFAITLALLVRRSLQDGERGGRWPVQPAGSETARSSP